MRSRSLVPLALSALLLTAGCLGAPDDGGSTDGGAADAGPTGGDADAGVTGPFASCAEVPADACFSNADCATDLRCSDVGTPDLPVPCCVGGARGTVAAGETCTSSDDCESGVCIGGDASSGCSMRCEVDADCPVGMQRCYPIAMETTSESWCFPE